VSQGQRYEFTRREKDLFSKLMDYDAVYRVYEKYVIVSNFQLMLSTAMDVNFSTLEMMRGFKYAASAAVANQGDIMGLMCDKALGEPDMRSFLSAHFVGEMLKLGESGSKQS
jgi:uncharacterized protein (DUF488 family)